MGRPVRRKSLVEHPGDALVGRSVVADGSIFHESPTQKFPGKVTGRPKARKDRVHVMFDGDETEYWFPIDLVKTWLVDEDSAQATAFAAALRKCWIQQNGEATAATPGSAAAKVASALRRHSGLSLLGWGRAPDRALPVQDGSLATRLPGWPAVSAAHVGWGAGALFAVATVLGLVSNYGMFHVREGAS